MIKIIGSCTSLFNSKINGLDLPFWCDKRIFYQNFFSKLPLLLRPFISNPPECKWTAGSHKRQEFDKLIIFRYKNVRWIIIIEARPDRVTIVHRTIFLPLWYLLRDTLKISSLKIPLKVNSNSHINTYIYIIGIITIKKKKKRGERKTDLIREIGRPLSRLSEREIRKCGADTRPVPTSISDLSRGKTVQ